MALAIGLALHALHFVIPGRDRDDVVGNMLLSWGGAWCCWTTARNPTWLPWAVGVGVLTHIAGDALTKAGRAGAGALAGPRGRGWPSPPCAPARSIEKAVLVPLFMVATVAFIWVNTDIRDAFDPIVDRFVSSG